MTQDLKTFVEEWVKLPREHRAVCLSRFNSLAKNDFSQSWVERTLTPSQLNELNMRSRTYSTAIAILELLGDDQ